MAVTIKGATTIKGVTKVLSWTPASLFSAGQQGVWYDPSDFSTMFQDTGGATPVTAVGQSVARINDKSGRGNNATQSTAANRPTLQMDLNGNYYLSFDGSNDSMNTSSASFLSSVSSFTSVGGWLIASEATYGSSLYSAGNSFSNDIMFSYDSPSNKCFTQVDNAADGSAIDSINTSINTAYVDTVTFVGSLATPTDRIARRRNGASVSQSFSSYSPPTTTPVISSPFYVGVYQLSPVYRLNGRIYNFILRVGAMNLAETAATEDYINRKCKAY